MDRMDINQMKKFLIVLTPVFVFLTSGAFAFDQKTIDAARLCHNYVWDIPEFSNLPNAAISVFPSSSDDEGNYVSYWNVNWDDPKVRRAGTCHVKGDAVLNFEDYVKDSQN